MSVITIISHTDILSEETVAELKHAFEAEHVSFTSAKRLSPRAVDLYPSNDEFAKVDSFIRDQSKEAVDIIYQPLEHRQNKKLFIFDMDSTLIYQEVIELIAAYADIEDEVAEITERAMNGEIDFTESLRQRVKLLKGIDSTSIWEELKHKIIITKGVPELCKALKKAGCVMGVCSGGFIQLAEHVKTQLGLDYAYANVLGIDENNVLDGTVVGEPVNSEMKAKLLLEIAANHNIDPKLAVAVGDGANDLKMMEAAGFGIAWNAKPKVQKLAPAKLNTSSMSDILYIMGYTDEDIEQLK